MKNILFINTSPNRAGNTNRIGENALQDKNYDVLHLADYQICQYGVVDDTDQINEVLKTIDSYDTIIIGSPIYWYTIGGILKTFIDRLYLLPEAKALQGKKLYAFVQGSSPSQETNNAVQFLFGRMAKLMDIELQNVIVDTSDGQEIIRNLGV
ncbi:MAG: flavodoxin family protein [Coprobacillaceae bacterium]